MAHPTARKWVITPVINGIFVGLIHWNHWGELTHLLSGMSHQVGKQWSIIPFLFVGSPFSWVNNIYHCLGEPPTFQLVGGSKFSSPSSVCYCIRSRIWWGNITIFFSRTSKFQSTFLYGSTLHVVFLVGLNPQFNRWLLYWWCFPILWWLTHVIML